MFRSKLFQRNVFFSYLRKKRKKSLLPVVLQRQTLVDGLARYLAQLGLERRHKAKTLDNSWTRMSLLTAAMVLGQGN
jgi:hypothetical protein